MTEDSKEQHEVKYPGDRKKWQPEAAELVVPLAELTMEETLSGTESKHTFLFKRFSHHCTNLLCVVSEQEVLYNYNSSLTKPGIGNLWPMGWIWLAKTVH